ncbi:Leucyl/phenylalanyl-tRNA--protein transferase [Dissulfuribacter thermophilus]|uniref:Leucyl/phenylalanyl-tRNA--protein transferase n=1 Tax=Dissulfuribacter thermophilus TaxID=1156395 RepID=A0A1B9F6J2_9BACT|nr:leucyl/phenylalanyl-tRNA--protein transferase [Dissulfuribacter thermophilus]OCC15464.1 Leucyl/phenylalanyl-tRNA--protein transferase [Dissulfuribacter thermophilus]
MPVFLLSKELYFPDPELSEPNGLLAVGGDLRVERLILAYKNGIFPWYGVGEPILWWCPDPRLVLFPEELHVSRRLRRTIKQNKFRVSWDEAFVDVITLCKNTRTETWITDEMRNAYIELYKAGYAHSIEAWEEHNLVGGLYGVKIGKVFFGESMFALKKDASKVAFVQGVDHLTKMGIRLIDCQVETEHLKSFGARLIPRQIFLTLLKKLT